MKKLLSATALLLASIPVAYSATASLDVASLVEKEGPAVVNISTTQTVVNNQGGPGMSEDDPFYEFFRRFQPRQQPREFQARSLGSGFIISQDGYIMTNAHVVGNADEITVKLTDKREFKAKVIGTDERTDVALIKIEAKLLPTVRLGDPAKLRVGEPVVAIGSPFGFDNTVTSGIVSAKGRQLPDESFVPFIQTDAAVNPGNSGGPLFNANGEVVGINSQIYSRTGGFMGLSFAIPIDVAMDISTQLKAGGKVIRGRIGVSIQEMSRDLAESFGLTKPQGALISGVEKDGPADKAGMLPSDIVLKFGDKVVNSNADLVRLVGSTKPGTRMTMQVWRNKTTKDLTVTVGEMQDQPGPGKPGRRHNANVGQVGLMVGELTAAQRKQLGVEYGLLVQASQGAAARSGIQQGDVIVGIGGEGLKSYQQLARAIEDAKTGNKTVTLRIYRDGGYQFIPLKLSNKSDE
ncbi:serine protease Do [Chitinivorax tropicus]|uniref:Probable periplasmic serine endoprotease DegP-like n=1 Tax=Chitinivorax tropicus TaxID=714531 RepID=A0A840MUY5_9PROT|nr:DegQ family serine endoprotease [Chitinivorax tropicus]MBB5020166.1 serine protease Do [Chitinivorax tropicus]